MSYIPYKERVLSYRVEKDNLITKIPTNKKNVLQEALRLEKIFVSDVVLTKAQFNVIKTRYYNLMCRDVDLSDTLDEAFNKFIEFQVHNNPEHIEDKWWNFCTCKNT